MFSNKKHWIPQTVVARLTVWYAVIAAVFCTVLLVIVSAKVSYNVSRRIDHELVTELKEFEDVYHDEGMQGLRAEFEREVEASGAHQLFCRFLTPDAVPILTSNITDWKNLETWLQTVPLPADDEPMFSTLYPKNNPFNARMATLRTADGHLLQLGINLQTENKSHGKIQRLLIISSLLMLTLSTLSGWVFAHRAMAGVQRVTAAVSRIYRDSPNEKVPFVNEGREIDELVDAFNRMLLRIESLIHEIKEVSDNVAHDLRSPVTRMRGIAETTLTGPQDLDAYREMGLTIIEESDRITEIINTTLEIAQTESGLLQIEHHSFDLRTILQNAAELFLPLAEEKQIRLCVRLLSSPIICSGDKTRIQRVAANLLDNAIK